MTRAVPREERKGEEEGMTELSRQGRFELEAEL